MTATAGRPLLGLKRHLRAELVAGEGVYIFSESGVTVLKGVDATLLAALMDGTRTLESLLGAVPEGMTPEQVIAVVMRLTEAGLLALRPPDPADTDPCSLAYWEASGVDSAAAVAATAGTRLHVSAVGRLAEDHTAAAVAALRAAGLTAGDGPENLPDAELSVVLCDDYLNPRLAEIDARHRAAGVPWLLAKPAGTRVWLGPVFHQAEQGCWQCLATGLWQHRSAEACAQSTIGHSGPAPCPIATVPPLMSLAWNLIALEAGKWLAGIRHPGQRAVWTLNSLTMEGRLHPLRPYPQCAACGDPTLMREQARRPVVLRPRLKASRTGNGDRAVAPDQLLERYRHLVSPVTGVIKAIRRDQRGPAFFNCFRSGMNSAVSVRDLDHLSAVLRQENGGKGVTALDAEVSALCEGVERHCGNFHGDEERVTDSMRGLGEVAIHPNSCMLFDERQYARRHEWNAVHSAFQHVCDRFDPEAAMDWTPVWSLSEQRHRMLPTGLLYFGVPAERDRRFVRADSNGNAAGSSVEDAVLQGLFELVERDSVALWWYNRVRVPGVDLVAFADPWLDELVDVYASLGRRVWALDLTSDLGIPAMVALSARTEGRPEVMFGFGAHLDPRTAVRRALTELNQMMPAVLPADGARWPDGADPDAAAWWRETTLDTRPYLMPDSAVAPLRPTGRDRVSNRDLLADITEVRGRIESRGMQVLVLDQTRPDIGLPVVKVLVPGLRHFWARFGPGRLFDVPVALGRLPRPTDYEDLNPFPMFL